MGYFVGLGGSVTVYVPTGLALTVAFTDSAGSEVAVYEEGTRETLVTQPAAITSTTSYYLAAETEVAVSVKLANGTEIATADGLPYTTEIRGDAGVVISPVLSALQALLESNIYASPDGTRWSLSVADDGTVSATEIVPA